MSWSMWKQYCVYSPKLVLAGLWWAEDGTKEIIVGVVDVGRGSSGLMEVLLL